MKSPIHLVPILLTGCVQTHRVSADSERFATIYIYVRVHADSEASI